MNHHHAVQTLFVLKETVLEHVLALMTIKVTHTKDAVQNVFLVLIVQLIRLV